jgi:hypothetical protein
MKKCKYQNPIAKVTTVTIPTWEYTSLVANATTLEILEQLIKSDKKYMAADLMEILFSREEEDS